MKKHKIHKMVTLDLDIVNLGEAKGINFSKVLNEYLNQYLLVDKDAFPDEKDLLITERAELQVKSNIVDEKLRKIKAEEQKVLEAKLAKQKQREEDIRTGRLVIMDD